MSSLKERMALAEAMANGAEENIKTLRTLISRTEVLVNFRERYKAYCDNITSGKQVDFNELQALVNVTYHLEPPEVTPLTMQTLLERVNKEIAESYYLLGVATGEEKRA